MTIGHSGFFTETERSVRQTISDLLVIGTQECLNETKEWESRLQGTLGPSHVMFHSHHLGTIHIAIFIRRDLVRLWLPIDRKNSAGSACCVSAMQNILLEQNEFFHRGPVQPSINLSPEVHWISDGFFWLEYVFAAGIRTHYLPAVARID